MPAQVVAAPVVTGVGGARPQPHQTGLVYDYFGPDAVQGPYSVMSPPEQPREPRDRAVGVYPETPEEIVGPVEIDSSRVEDRVSVAGAGSASEKIGDDEINAIKEKEESEKKEAARKAGEDAYGPFELMASPSPPLSTEEADEPRFFGGVSPSPEPSRSLH